MELGTPRTSGGGAMTRWTADELDRLSRAEEVQVSSARADGRLRPYVTIWVVRVDDEIYVRAAFGPANGWFRRALASGRGRLRADGVHRDVTFESAAADVREDVAAAYQEKYEQHGPLIVGSVAGLGADLTAIRLVPRES